MASLVGLLLGALLTFPLSNLPGWLGALAPTLITIVFALLGVYVAVMRRRDLLDTIREDHPPGVDALRVTGKLGRFDSSGFTGGNRMQIDGQQNSDKPQSDKYVLVDTSAIIDGRIADISQTGFIDGTLLVPRFVLNELQHIADSPDALRRARGRRGLDMLIVCKGSQLYLFRLVKSMLKIFPKWMANWSRSRALIIVR